MSGTYKWRLHISPWSVWISTFGRGSCITEGPPWYHVGGDTGLPFWYNGGGTQVATSRHELFSNSHMMSCHPSVLTSLGSKHGVQVYHVTASIWTS